MMTLINSGGISRTYSILEIIGIITNLFQNSLMLNFIHNISFSKIRSIDLSIEIKFQLNT